MLISRAWLCCFLTFIYLREAQGQEDDDDYNMLESLVNNATDNINSSTKSTDLNEDVTERQEEEDLLDIYIYNNSVIDNINSSTDTKPTHNDNNNITSQLQLFKDALQEEIFSITHKYINISDRIKVKTEIDKTFEHIERIMLAQEKAQSTDNPLKITCATTTIDPTTPATTTTTTTTTTPSPIRKCGENMTNRCVRRWDCKTQTTVEEKYIINLREENECHYLETCCSDSNIRNVTLPSHSVDKDSRCGLTNPKGVYFTIVGNVRDEANFGEYPWIVGVYTILSEYRVGGSLIAPRVVLSTANILNKIEDFKVRAGDWDMATENEILPYQERSAKIIPNTNYSLQPFSNNIALLILNATFSPAVHVRPICLPEGGIFDYTNCIAAGWNRYTRNGRSIVTTMRLSVTKCADGTHDSFLCVTGNSHNLAFSTGSALVCPKVNESPNRYYQIGSWSHGDTPNRTMFTNVEKFLDWIHNEIDQVN